jgi:flagellar biosynthetic protein FlhB
VSGKEERTEAPTPKRKREARRDGRIAHTPEIGSWAAVLIATFVVPALLGRVGKATGDSVRALRDLPAAPEPADALAQLSSAMQNAMFATIPLLLVVATTLVVANLAQVGLVLTTKPLKPNFGRLNPAKGARQLLSTHSLWDTAKSLARVGLLALIAVPAVTGVARAVLEQGRLDLRVAIPLLGARILRLVRLFAVLALVLAAVDYLVARRRINRQVRMTKQEIKEEHRHSEGDPHVKAKLRSMRRMLSQNSMISAAANADVLVVNPTHFAVAVRYEREIGVPVVVARGTDKVALRMREVARSASVPVVEEKPLARALYWTCDVGDTIPRELFEGVARVLAFVYSLSPAARRDDAHRLPVSVGHTIPASALEPGARTRVRAESRRARRGSTPTQDSVVGRSTHRSGAWSDRERQGDGHAREGGLGA